MAPRNKKGKSYLTIKSTDISSITEYNNAFYKSVMAADTNQINSKWKEYFNVSICFSVVELQSNGGTATNNLETH
jgi:hypothetical protein